MVAKEEEKGVGPLPFLIGGAVVVIGAGIAAFTIGRQPAPGAPGAPPTKVPAIDKDCGGNQASPNVLLAQWEVPFTDGTTATFAVSRSRVVSFVNQAQAAGTPLWVYDGAGPCKTELRAAKFLPNIAESGMAILASQVAPGTDEGWTSVSGSEVLAFYDGRIKEAAEAGQQLVETS